MGLDWGKGLGSAFLMFVYWSSLHTRQPKQDRSFIIKCNIDQHAKIHQWWLYVVGLGQISAIGLCLVSAELVLFVELLYMPEQPRNIF